MLRASILLGVLASGFHTLGLAATRPDDAPVRTSFRRELANVEYFQSRLAVEADSTGRCTLAEACNLWKGHVPYLRDDSTRSSGATLPFTVRYVNGLPVAVTVAAAGESPRSPDLYVYPGKPGTRSFHLSMPVRSSSGDPGSNLVRIVLEPAERTDLPPGYRAQWVYANAGWFVVDGDSMRAFLYDGNRDGVYSQGLGDGIFVDVNHDGVVEIDMMSPEFGPFSTSFQLAGSIYRVTAVHPDGDWIESSRVDGVADRPMALRVGASAPPVACQSHEGKPMRLADHGKVTLLYFWASWCSTCRFQAPRIRDVVQEFHPRGLEVLGFSYDESLDSMKTHLEKYAHDWPTYFSSGRKPWEDPIARAYGARGAGMMFLVDAEGRYRGKYTRVDDVRSTLASILAK